MNEIIPGRHMFECTLMTSQTLALMIGPKIPRWQVSSVTGNYSANISSVRKYLFFAALL